MRGRIAAGGRTLQNIASQLLENCLAVDPKLTRGIGGDNMTAIIQGVLDLRVQLDAGQQRQVGE